jgi:1,4-alpha-glucan branching enzyme
MRTQIRNTQANSETLAVKPKRDAMTIIHRNRNWTQLHKTLVEFALEEPQAASVNIAGSFNDWSLKPLRKDGDRWKTTIFLPPGRHEYRFVVGI